MSFASRLLVMTAVLLVTGAVRAQAPAPTTKESAPMEPPYTKETEFDPLAGEDPLNSQQIPSSSDPKATQAPKKAPVQLKAGDSSAEPFATESLDNYPSEPAARPTQAPRSATTQATKELHSKDGVRMVHHPDAAKGLIRIEQDGTYVYQIPTTVKNRTGIMRFGSMAAPDISSQDNLTNFRQMYGASLFSIGGDYEWHPFQSFGKQLGIQAGLSLGTAQGHGAFVSGGNDPPPLEKYTFIAVPLNVGIIYRLQFFNRQWVAPYVSGGASYIGIAELRDDNKNHFAGTPAGYGAGGLMFNLSAMDKDIAFAMDSEYGIGTLWVITEFRYIEAFSSVLNFSGPVVSLGFGADF